MSTAHCTFLYCAVKAPARQHLGNISACTADPALHCAEASNGSFACRRLSNSNRNRLPMIGHTAKGGNYIAESHNRANNSARGTLDGPPVRYQPPRFAVFMCTVVFKHSLEVRDSTQPIRFTNHLSQRTMTEVVRQPSMLLDTEDVGSDSASDFDRVLDRAVHSMGSNSLTGHSKSNVASVKKLKQSTDQCSSPGNKRQAPIFKIRSKPACSDQDEQGSHSSSASPVPGSTSSSDTTAMLHVQPISDDCKRKNRDQLKVRTSTEQHLTRQNSVDSGLMSPSSFIGLVAAARPTSQPSSSNSPASNHIRAPAKPAARQIFKEYIKVPVQMRQQVSALQPSNCLNSADSKYVGVRSAAVLPRSGECSPCLGSTPTPSLSMNVAALQAGFVGLAMGY